MRINGEQGSVAMLVMPAMVAHLICNRWRVPLLWDAPHRPQMRAVYPVHVVAGA